MSEQPITTYLSSPNLIAAQLFNEAARQLDEMRDKADNCARVASVVILVMSALESFLNSYFHQLAFQLKKAEFLNTVTTCKDKEGHVSTRRKILTWPQHISGKSINVDSPEFKNFEKVRELRDKLVHYKPDEMKWGHPTDLLKFVPDHKISFYKSLTKEKGIDALRAIIELVGEIGTAAQGFDGTSKIVFVANWSGRWPDQMPSIGR